MPKNFPLTDEEFKEIYSKVPRACVDIVLQTPKGILLIKRRIDPYKGHWHLPGGTIYLREKAEDAVRRILKKEIGLKISNLSFVGFSEILKEKKSKRHSISLVYLVKLNKSQFSLDSQGEKFAFFKKISRELRIVNEHLVFLKKEKFIR